MQANIRAGDFLYLEECEEVTSHIPHKANVRGAGPEAPPSGEEAEPRVETASDSRRRSDTQEYYVIDCDKTRSREPLQSPSPSSSSPLVELFIARRCQVAVYYNLLANTG